MTATKRGVRVQSIPLHLQPEIAGAGGGVIRATHRVWLRVPPALRALQLAGSADEMPFLWGPAFRYDIVATAQLADIGISTVFCAAERTAFLFAAGGDYRDVQQRTRCTAVGGMWAVPGSWSDEPHVALTAPRRSTRVRPTRPRRPARVQPASPAAASVPSAAPPSGVPAPRTASPAPNAPTPTTAVDAVGAQGQFAGPPSGEPAAAPAPSVASPGSALIPRAASAAPPTSDSAPHGDAPISSTPPRKQLTPISSPHHEEEAGEDADVEEALVDLEKVVCQRR